MRLSTLAGAALALLVQLAAQDGGEQYPWCAVFDPFTRNCGYLNYQQCLAAVAGTNAQCRPNADYTPAPPSAGKAH